MSIRSVLFNGLVPFAATLPALLVPASAQAASTRLVAVASARDFLAGDASGTAITADGRLTLSSPLAPKVWPEDAADAAIFDAAADKEGRVFIATGGGLGRLFVSTPDGKVSLVFTAKEPNLTALAIAPDGSVIVGSSPNGKIYRIDARRVAGRVAGDSAEAISAASADAAWEIKEAAIWALAFGKDGTLYVGTGNKGRLYKRNAKGELALFHEVDDVHVRSLAIGPDGTVYAGTSDQGRLIAIRADGSGARTLHDFGKPEVTGIAVTPQGIVYAAGTAAEPPTLATSASAQSESPRSGGGPSATPPPREEPPRGSVSVATSTSPVRSTSPPSTASRDKGAEIVMISPDGFVEPAWAFPEETIYSLRGDGDALVLTTGPRGRVYRWRDRRVQLEAQTDQQQAVAAPHVPGGLAIVTMSTPGVIRSEGKPRSGTYVSAVKDAGRLSTFGRLRFEGEVPAGAAVVFSVRAGNAEKPDRTWTEWTKLSTSGRESSAKLPAARFFQWKAELSATPKGEAPVLERIEYSYAERNAKPILESVAVLEPGAVFQKGGASGTAVLSVTSPDENGIYAGLESPREGTPDNPGKKLYRKGYRTVSWKGTDPNGDTLRYELEASPDGSSVWFPIRKDIDDSFLSFDSAALPDGRYRFRVTASDRLANPDGQEAKESEESALVIVDNTAPALSVESRRLLGDDVELRVKATDALSPVTRAEGTLNADRWRVLPTADAVADTASEVFVFRVKKPAGQALLSVRVVDSSGNAAVVSAEYPKEFR